MKTVRVFSGLSLLIMFGMIAFAVLTGDFAGEGSILMSMVWGQMSLEIGRAHV